MELQRLNLSNYRRGTRNEKLAFARKLVLGLSTRGFIKLDHHDFDEQSVKTMFDWNERFFQLDEDTKGRCAHVPGPWPQRGYSAIGGENFAKYHSLWTGVKPPKAQRDHKELYDVGPQNDDDFPNRWPDEAALPGFRAYMERTYRQFDRITFDVLEALELGLSIQPGSLTSKVVGGASEFRMINYPPLTMEEAKGGAVSRAHPHYDIGVISLLFQDSVGGLEIDDGRGGFGSVVADHPADLIVNAAETLQRWTNDALKAGLHRVTIPPSMDPGAEGSLPTRRSVVYFCKANRRTSVAPLRDFVDDANEGKYDDVTFMAYHQRRVQSAYA